MSRVSEFEASPEWRALRAEEERLEAELRVVREQKRALAEERLGDLPDYP